MTQGPQGTGKRFLDKVAKLKALGKSDLQSRRIASVSGSKQNAVRK